MHPTVVCNNATQDTVDLTYAEFGAVVLSTNGTIDSVLRCDVATSDVIGLQPSITPLSNADFLELSPLMLLTFAIAWGIRFTRQVFETPPGRF